MGVSKNRGTLLGVLVFLFYLGYKRGAPYFGKCPYTPGEDNAIMKVHEPLNPFGVHWSPGDAIVAIVLTFPGRHAVLTSITHTSRRDLTSVRTTAGRPSSPEIHHLVHSSAPWERHGVLCLSRLCWGLPRIGAQHCRPFRIHFALCTNNKQACKRQGLHMQSPTWGFPKLGGALLGSLL